MSGGALPYLEIFTDGSAIGNGKPDCVGAGAWIINDKSCGRSMSGVYLDDGRGQERCTSIRMEMMPVIEALEWAYHNIGQCSCTVHSDSAYLINCMVQKWYIKWQLNGWVTTGNNDVANQDLWLRLIAMLDTHRIVWVKVKGHSGHHYNEMCDRKANEAAKKLAIAKKERERNDRQRRSSEGA